MPTRRHRDPDNPDATPKADTRTAVELKASNSATALAALYQGEKTDAAYVFNTAMVMMGAAVAYLVGALPFAAKLSEGPIPRLSLCLLPAPLWLIIAFHSLITLNAMSHGISVRIIEDALFAASALRGIPVQRELVGSAAGDKIMDVSQSKFIHGLTTVVVYAGIASLVGGFTYYALHLAAVAKADAVLTHAPVVGIARATYLLLLVMVVLSWTAGLGIVKAGREQAKKYAEYWSKREQV